MPIVPVADFVPDQAAYLNTGLQRATNTFPREDGSDGPINGPSVLTIALPGACRGAILCSAGYAAAEMTAGTATGLYTLALGGAYFADGYVGVDYVDDDTWVLRSSASTYAVPSGRDWRFTQFGDRVIATNYADPIVYRVIGSETDFATLSTDAPRARFIATIEPGFVIVGDYVSGSVARPNGVWWSALNDSSNWPTPGTQAALSVQSDNQVLALGDAITGILPAIGGANGAIFTERSIYRIQYQGPPTIFGFAEIDRSRGCVAPGSLVQVGAAAYFLSDEGFCSFDGTSVASIGFGRVDRFFWQDADASKLLDVRATVDPYRRLIVWSYIDRAGAPRWLTYSYAANRWRYGADSALATQAFVHRIAPGVDATLTTLATNAFGWGGRLLLEQGGYLLQENGDKILLGSNQPANWIAAFDGSSRLVGFVGDTLEATLETGEADAQGRRVFVKGGRLLTDAATAQLALGVRDAFSTPITYTQATAAEITGICPQRVSTRYARARVTIPAGTEWTYLQGVDVMIRSEGRR